MTASNAVERIARAFHNVYEDIAEEEGWATQQGSRTAFPNLPEANQRTMLRTVEALLTEGTIADGPEARGRIDQALRWAEGMFSDFAKGISPERAEACAQRVREYRAEVAALDEKEQRS